MHSAIYSGYVWHHRHLPRTHKFRYRVFMMYLDLAELDDVLALSRWWSVRRFAPARFSRSDYFMLSGHDESQQQQVAGRGTSDPLSECSEDTGKADSGAGVPSIDESVRAAVENKLNMRPSGAIRVLTNCRYFGYLINPISCYYCFDESDENLQAVLIEVTNTPWGERTHYVLDLRQHESGQAVDFDKNMHVSPFMPMRMTYRWKGSLPGSRLSYSLASFIATEVDGDVQTDNHRDIPDNRRPAGSSAVTEPHRQFDSGVNFKRIEITSSSLNRVLWQYPWMTGKVAFAIYWQALKLWLKHIPFVPHPNRVHSIGK